MSLCIKIVCKINYQSNSDNGENDGDNDADDDADRSGGQVSVVVALLDVDADGRAFRSADLILLNVTSQLKAGKRSIFGPIHDITSVSISPTLYKQLFQSRLNP
jgi:hypothetical protein